MQKLVYYILDKYIYFRLIKGMLAILNSKLNLLFIKLFYNFIQGNN